MLFSFYRAMHVVLARYCYRKSSVCPSVTLRYRGHLGSTNSKIITRIISLGLRSSEPRHRQSSPNSGEIGRSVGLWQEIRNISEMGQDRTKVIIDDQYWRFSIGNLVPKSTFYDLEGSLIMHSVSKHMRLSEPTTKSWMKIDLKFQRRRYTQWLLISDNIRFMRIFTGFPEEEASNYSG